MMPAAMIAATALPAFSTSSNDAMITRAQCGFGKSLTVTSVTTNSIPSEPMASASRSKPGASSASLPTSMGSPSIVKPRSRITLCTVSPYLRQCTPPEFSATLPPIEQAIWLEGSGA